MTKLMEWMLGIGIFTAIWGAIVTHQVRSKFFDDWMHIITPLPVLLVLCFALYSVIVILWRVYNFNNCEEAAKELQQQIKEAKEDLRKKGLTFDDDS